MFKYHLYLPRSASPASGSENACYLLPMLNEAWMGHAKERDWIETRRHNTLYCAPRLYSLSLYFSPYFSSMSFSFLDHLSPYLSLFICIRPLSLKLSLLSYLVSWFHKSLFIFALSARKINIEMFQKNQFLFPLPSIVKFFTWIQYC